MLYVDGMQVIKRLKSVFRNDLNNGNYGCGVVDLDNDADVDV